MKSFLLSVLIISLMTISNLYSQDIKAKLKGHQAVNGFTVVDDNHKVLFRVTGEGNVGINTPDPNGIFDIQGGTSTTGDGRGINIMAEAGSLEGGNAGGNIMIKSGASSGWDGDPALIFLSGGKNTGVGGSINIYSGHGGDYGGDINIMSSVSHLFHEGANNILSKTTNVLSEIKVGDINIGTNNSNLWGGKISIFTGEDNLGGGSIEITTGNSTTEVNNISLTTGGAEFGGGGNITLKTGGNEYSPGQGDIILNPTPNGGMVKINGSGTYTGTWTQASDERFKKNIEQIQNAVDKIQQLTGVNYEFKSDEFPEKNFVDGKQIGLVAQDVEKVFPELVKADAEGYKSVAYQNMVAVLIEAVKEQQKSIDELKKEVEKLKSNQTIEITANTETNN